VKTGLACQLWMECCGEDVALPYGHDAAIVKCGEDGDIRADALHDRRPDEDAMYRRIAKHWYLDVSLERLELSPEGIALHGYVEQREDRVLAIADLAREQDHARTGAHDRGPLASQVQDRLSQAPAVDELAHGRGFATWHDKSVESFEVLRQAHGDGLRSERGEHGLMFGKSSLDAENADLHGEMR
jgi:hypothetical protein